jgi:copper chaperone CopZ
MTTELRVEGMNCENCVRHVREALEKINGVERVDLDLATSQATIEHEDGVAADRLVIAIEDEGYTATSIA